MWSDESVCQSVGQFREQISHFLFNRRLRIAGGIVKKGNRLFFGAELALVADEAFLIDVAQAESR